ncbi:MAG TPA: histidine kinase [Streptosporangiaceae bacterium]|nr:histidine kinase [Streptosporangiaceae bacterium]
MFRSLAARRNPAAGSLSLDLVRLMDIVRTAALVIVLVTVSIAKPHPAAGGRGLAIAVTLAVAAASWIAWILAGHSDGRGTIAALIAMGGAGGALAALSPNSPAVAVGCMVAFSAGTYLSTGTSLGITTETLAVFLAIALATGAPTGILLGYPLAFAGVWTTGLTRRSYRVRAEQAELMLAETRRAHEAETQAAALAERARIAREIHDVLAHSLAAVSVNLQAAEGLLASGTLPADNLELAKACDCIARAGTLTREGLAAARRAVLALRDDTAPLPGQLSSLAEQYRAAGDLTVDFSITGKPRPLSGEASLAAYRTAQEALTNARKHAPGQPVTLTLGFEPAEITISVVNPLPPSGTGGSLAATGAGYGLAGLRERAALAGGALEAGPAEGNWRVALRIPA